MTLSLLILFGNVSRSDGNCLSRKPLEKRPKQVRWVWSGHWGPIGTFWDNSEYFLTSLEHFHCFPSPLQSFSPIISSLKKTRSGPTDGPTDWRSDRPSYRDARTHLKTTRTSLIPFLPAPLVSCPDFAISLCQSISNWDSRSYLLRVA